jgi:hypothetical protein
MSGATTGTVRIMLRLEGLAVLVASLICYARFGSSWGLFASCFLIPDLSFLGYLAGARVGSVAYNAAHSYMGAVACLCAGAVASSPLLVAAGLIWCAHIGFDRALGYGLKYSQGFAFTHLGLIGRIGREASNPSIERTA